MSEDVNDLIVQRRKKLDEILASGEDPFKSRFSRTDHIDEIQIKFSKIDPGDHTDTKVSLAGRLMAMRRHGKASFSELIDSSGKIQLYMAIDVIGEKAYRDFLKLDIGDFVGVSGEVFKTRRGELSIAVESFSLLTKSIRPMPEKWHGLKDIELRYRQRYLDLLMNPHVKDVFIKKTSIVKEIRNYLDSQGFIEVETPMLQPIPGGAAARPFTTYHNALGTELFLRIAPELYLKKLIIGGFEKIYELNKSFRNEGISTKHNPEFLMLEVYQAFADYRDMMKLTQDLIVDIVKKIYGDTKIKYQGETIDLSTPWEQITMLDAIKKHAGVEVSFDQTLDQLKQIAKKLEVSIEPRFNKGGVICEIFEKKVEEKLVQPTFVIDYPRELSPLARPHAENKQLTERFELIVAGRELANAFSELTDPRDQRQRFNDQRVTGRKEETPEIDDDFIKALEHGMPPTGGLGIGIDRLVMLLTDSSSIRDVIFFPQLRTSH